MPTVKRHVAATARPTRYSTCKVVIDLGKEYNLSGFRMLPRAEKGAPGLIKDYAIYVKTNDFKY